MNPKDIKNIRRQIKILPWIAWLFVALGFAALFYGVWKCAISDKGFSLENMGIVGSYMQGAVASIWSLAGLLFIYVAFLAQKQQLIHQEAELEGQEQQFQKQQDSINRQIFENSFFQLLNFQNQITEQLKRKISGSGKEAVFTAGRQCFEEWYLILDKVYRTGSKNADENELFYTIKAYAAFYENRQSSLPHYFRTLYHVFKFVDESSLTLKEKKRYTCIVRAQLSSGELMMLFYNCISTNGEKFKPLVEKFGLLEHLNKKRLLDPSHEKFYADSAYE